MADTQSDPRSDLIFITQVRSVIGAQQGQRRTLRALAFGSCLVRIQAKNSSSWRSSASES